MPAKEPSRPLSVPEGMELSLADQIRQIVEHNVRSGRFQRVCNFHGQPLTLEEYTDIVTTYYSIHHSLVARLNQGEPEAWELMSRRLFRGAYTLLQQRGWRTEQAIARAQEATQEACLGIYCQIYPYDCPFDAWAFTILRYHVFRTHRRPHSPLDRPGLAEPLEQLAAQEAIDPADFAAIERSELLLRALGKLRSATQRLVIECLFFEELSPAEIAQKLGKTIQAVYNLKGHALANLRVLLETDELE